MLSQNQTWDVCVTLSGSACDKVNVKHLVQQSQRVLATYFHSPLSTNENYEAIRSLANDFSIDVVVFTPRCQTTLQIHEYLNDEYGPLVRFSSSALNALCASRWNIHKVADCMSEATTAEELIGELLRTREFFRQILVGTGKFSDYDLISHLFHGDLLSKDWEVVKVRAAATIPFVAPTADGCSINRNDAADKAWPTVFMGFDPTFTRIMQERQDELLSRKPDFHLPASEPFAGLLKYCIRCCLPETAEGLLFDENGMCPPCRSSEEKMHIDWEYRFEQLKQLLAAQSEASPGTYSALIPISGGKDSAFQLHFMTNVLQVRILACTFSHNWYSPTGIHNLETCLAQFNVDHLMMFPSRSVVNQLAKQSLSKIGDSCWHCHAGVGAFPLQVAIAFGVDLLIWGESVAERDGRATYHAPIEFDREYFLKISSKVEAKQMVSDFLDEKDLVPYHLPAKNSYKEAGIRGIHLGDFIFWDDERQMEFIRDTYGWREDDVEGTYKGYKSVECLMSGMHDYSKFVKRGFGRATDHASQDVRAGLITRGEGLALIQEYDSEVPRAMTYYSKITNLSPAQILQELKDKREGAAKNLPHG